MTVARAMPYLILVALVGGITLAFLRAQTPAPEPPTPEGALVRIGPVLRGFRESADPQRDAAIFVAAALDGQEGEPRAGILEALNHGDWGAQWAGTLAVGQYGASDEALGAALSESMGAGEPLLRAAAARAASYCQEREFSSLLPRLQELCADAVEAVRVAALASLGRRAARYPELIALFERALGDPARACRAQAARALAQIELQEQLAPEALEPLRAVLDEAVRDADAEVRMYAVMALGRVGGAAAPSVPSLLPLLKSQDPLLRGQAATALGSIGRAALPALEAALEEEQGSAAPPLFWALRLMGEPALPLLRKTLRHERPMLRLLAAQQLWELQQDVETAVDVLSRALDEPDLAVVLVAIRVLGRMGTEGAVALPALERLAAGSDALVARAAAAALEHLHAVEKGRQGR